MSGIGSDFVGTINQTRSKRDCLSWISTRIDKKYQSNTLFPEGSVQNASNYCRNPSQDPAGPWCFTNNNLEFDACPIPDCDKPGKEKLKDKSVPHIISSGSWTGFRLELPTGEVKLSYEGVPGSFFSWKHYLKKTEVRSLSPTYLTYTALTDTMLGIHFLCDECQTEVTSSTMISRIYSLMIWLESKRSETAEFYINSRGSDLDGAPKDGGWSEWSDWECSVSCGGGQGIRTRICNNPPPNLFGKACSGSNTISGFCNNFPCGDVPPRLLEEMGNNLKNKSNNLQLQSGNNFSFDCNPDMLEKVKAAAPSSKLYWSKDSNILTTKEELVNITMGKFNLDVKSASSDDSGVYLCILEHRDVRTIIQVVAVTVVTSDPTITVRATRQLILQCQAFTLSYIFGELNQVWIHDGLIWKDYGISSLGVLDHDIVESVKKSHQGTWQCVVKQEDLNLTWVTNWFRLKVLDRPNALTTLMDDKYLGVVFGYFNSQIFALIILLVIVAVVVGITAFIAYMIIILHKARMGPERRATKYKRLPKAGFEYEEMMSLFIQQYLPLKYKYENKEDSHDEKYISDDEVNKQLTD